MANIYNASATGALNEKAYINQIYDQIGNSQKDTLKENYEASIRQLDSGAQNVRDTAGDYLRRAYVESERAKSNAGSSPALGGYGSVGSRAQAALTLGNQEQANVTALKQQQTAADQEFERQRKLLAERYSAAIKQAQADNDMNRAQALYAAARAEEEQLRSLRQSAATLMAGKGDTSLLTAIGKGTASAPAEGATWSGVTKHEDSINAIYDSQIEAQRAESESAYKEGISDLEAKAAQAQQATDRSLTGAYVEALKKDKNYREIQTASGQGSGTAAQAQLAREAGLTAELTDLRRQQLSQDTGVEQQRLQLLRNYGDEIARTRASGNLKRVQELYRAAEQEEQNRIADQKLVGSQLAKQNNYSVLGRLYGLNRDQIDRLQGTGAYAPRHSDDDSGSRGRSYTADENAAFDFVDRMLQTATSSRFDPSRVVNGTNQLTSAQKEIAQEYLAGAIASGRMK